MITTNFNPSVVRAQNTRQNNVNFQRDFKPQEIQGIIEEEEDVLNNLITFIALKYIKKADMSPKSNEFFAKNANNPLVQHLSGLLDKYNK